MAKGENIFKRKDGRWEARYIKGHELSGKIRYGFCYGKTYKEAKEKVQKYKAAILTGKSIENKKTRFQFHYYCDEWLKIRKKEIKESTYVKYSAMLKLHIKPKLGNCYPLGMTSELMDDFTNELLFEDELSSKTVHDILVLLNSILKYTSAFFEGMFPTIRITYPKINKKEMRVLSSKEQSRFVTYLLENMDSCKFGVLLALFTGIRIGELCALRWENISLEEKTICINATMQRLHNTEENEDTRTQIMIGTPKSDTSVRIIPLMDDITELSKKIDPQNPKAYLLTGTEKYMEPRTLQYRMEKYTGECNLEGVHFHTLRHTFATRAVEAGFEIKSLSEILGHANTSITLELYVHSSMELKRENMRKLSGTVSYLRSQKQVFY